MATSDSPLSVPDVTLAVAAAQGASAPAGAPVITSITDNGDGTLTILGSGFGEKAQAAPIIWDMGTDVRINGVADDSHDVADGTSPDSLGISFSAGATVLSTARPRHAEISHHYASKDVDFNNAVQHSAHVGTPGNGPRLHSSFWLRMPADPKYLDSAPYSGLSGAFDTGPAGELGEELVITVDGTDYTGWCVDIDNPLYGADLFSVYSPNKALSSSSGQVAVRGVTSGAECVLDFTGTYQATPSAKLWRLNQGGASTEVRAIAALGIEQFFILRMDESGMSDFISMPRSPYAINLYDAANEGEWVFAETYMDWSDTRSLKGEFRLIGSRGQAVGVIPGVDGGEQADPVDYIVALIGMDSSVHPLHIDMGEIIIDKTSQRVVIGNAPVYEDCTIVERQYVSDWAGSSVVAELYAGQLTTISGNYLFVFDDKNQPSAGVQL